MNFSSPGKPSLSSRRRPLAPLRPAPARSERERAEAEIAGYIAQMTGEMMAMAAKARLDLLAYLLSIARTEAEVVARQGFTEPPTA